MSLEHDQRRAHCPLLSPDSLSPPKTRKSILCRRTWIRELQTVLSSIYCAAKLAYQGPHGTAVAQILSHRRKRRHSIHIAACIRTKFDLAAGARACDNRSKSGLFHHVTLVFVPISRVRRISMLRGKPVLYLSQNTCKLVLINFATYWSRLCLSMR